MTLMFLSTAYLAENSDHLDPQLYKVGHDTFSVKKHISHPFHFLNNEKELVKKWCEMNNIDEDAYFADKFVCRWGNSLYAGILKDCCDFEKGFFTMDQKLSEIIKRLDLKPLTFEGGYFAQTYISPESLLLNFLPKRYRSGKPYCTAIYYLLTADTYSCLHKLPTDEIWHFYSGDPAEQLQLYPDGPFSIKSLGNNVLNGEFPQIVAPKDCWQGTRLKHGGEWALMGCTMAPGFTESDFEVPDIDGLTRTYPKVKKLIIELSPPGL